MTTQTLPARVVFLSSTTKDLAQYREVAGDVIAALDSEYEKRFRLVKSDMFKEVSTGERTTAADTSEIWVKAADWVVLIVGFWYGYVPEDKGCSVTEHEFRTAIAQNKAVFVFMAGTKDQRPNNYKTIEDVEREDLKDHLTPVEHQKLFDAFLVSVSDKSIPTLFKNIDHFREQLKRTLEQRIDHELEAQNKPAPAGPDVTVIIAQQGLRDSVLATIESVKQLANLKVIHDRLHKCRQFGIRRWREEVLVYWPLGRPPPTEASSVFFQQMIEVMIYITEARGAFQLLTVVWVERLRRVSLVITHFGDGRYNLVEDREKFAELIDNFAKRQQAAFSDTNDTMRRCATELKTRHDQMISRGKVVLRLPTLKTDEVAELGKEMAESLKLHDSLQTAMSHHDDWQTAHDRLQIIDDELDAVLESDYPERALAITLAPAVDDLPFITTLAVGAPKLWTLDPMPVRITGNVNQLVRNCELLGEGRTIDEYRAMRKAFDDLFFEVDTVTLAVVQHSRKRADDFESRLRPKPPSDT